MALSDAAGTVPLNNDMLGCGVASTGGSSNKLLRTGDDGKLIGCGNPGVTAQGVLLNRLLVTQAP